MESPRDFTGPVNLGNPVEFTMRELAELVLKETGSRSDFVHLPLPQDDPRQRQPNISPAKAKLGWEPKVALADGLRVPVDYFRHDLTHRCFQLPRFGDVVYVKLCWHGVSQSDCYRPKASIVVASANMSLFQIALHALIPIESESKDGFRG